MEAGAPCDNSLRGTQPHSCFAGRFLSELLPWALHVYWRAAEMSAEGDG